MSHRNSIKKEREKKIHVIKDKKIKDDKMNDLKIKYEEKVQEADENRELLQRMKAEFDNYKKRVLNEYDEKIKLANEELIRRLLTVIDAFDRALNIEKNNDEKFQSFYNGVELISKQVKDILDEFELVEINPEKNSVFDPAVHEAVMVEESGKWKEDVVIEVFEKGYMLSSRLLRAAKVKVGRGKK